MQKPRSVYVHIPFCRHRCGYCNFTLIANRKDLVPAFLEVLETELRQVLVQPQEVDTLYLGGGTPSFLEPHQLGHLLKLMTKWLPPSPSAEISCEMNPLDCTTERLRVLSEFGVNRLSLGGQSFSQRKLSILERDHSGEQLRASIKRCREFIPNLSLDLIFAAPGESLAEWSGDVEAALELPVRHLSTYGLTIEKGSTFYGRMRHGEIAALNPDLQLEMYEYAMDRLCSAGWEHYEVSSFAKSNARSSHNENYWLGGTWWAFGPGAASFLPAEPYDDRATTRYLRRVNHGSTTHYIRSLRRGKLPIAETEAVSQEQYVRERLVFGLRRLEGVNLNELSRLWGQDVEQLFHPFLNRYIDQGFLCLDEDCRQLRLTRAGLVISDSLWPDLL